MKKITVIIFISLNLLSAVPYWEHDDFEQAEKYPKQKPVLQTGVLLERGDWQRWSYIHELIQTAGFVASMQVTDSLNPEFGGIIEGEDQLGIVETDNTQQAIWVWSRYYEITGDTVYFLNLRRAWVYVMNFPAYNEEGTESDYYRVWNCGLALFAESKFRAVFGDTSYRWYADTCVRYIMQHPLSFTVSDPFYRRLHPKVTSLAAGMLYQYGKDMADPVFMDSAVVYGNRVRVWIEQDPVVNINDEVWAMSGGTAVWGLCRSVFDVDTIAGISWLNTYLPYMKYYQPAGNWNNSWNIWYANAYNFSGRITSSQTYLGFHHALTDSMLIQDYDDDGGIPPTRSWNQYQDHSWVSNYMLFMGFQGLMDSIKNYDAGVNGISGRGPREFFLSTDSILIGVTAVNYGFLPMNNISVSVSGAYSADTLFNLGIGEEETLWFNPAWVPSDTGNFDFMASCFQAIDERPENDTCANTLRVRPLRMVQGSVIDSVTGNGIGAKLYFQFFDETTSVYFDSAQTDSLSGDFVLLLIDSLYRASIRTEIPYPDLECDYVYVTPDSISDLNIFSLAADLLVINRDLLGRYAEYYSYILDSLGITYKVWQPANQGLFPISRISDFINNIIIWYSGRSVIDNVTSAEQESLMTFLDNGGRLLLTGQNIGEEISSTVFYQDYLHARLISDSIFSLRCYSDFADSLGQNTGKFQTVGSGGAQNQYSRDLIAADSVAHEFVFYDSALANCAGIWFNDPLSSFKIVYVGFGLESINKAPWPGYVSRKDVLAAILDWFGMVKVEELYPGQRQQCDFAIHPNPARGGIVIEIKAETIKNSRDAGMPGCKKGDDIKIKIFDAAGRLVKSFNLPAVYSLLPTTLTWSGTDQTGRHIPAGVYFIRLDLGAMTKTRKAVLLR